MGQLAAGQVDDGHQVAARTEPTAPWDGGAWAFALINSAVPLDRLSRKLLRMPGKPAPPPGW